jgi:tRNA nucleotidyltransferase (CCA-adding enzyme)
MHLQIRTIDAKNASALEELAQRIADSEGRAYLVGGAVRCLLRGEVPMDYDVEVFGLTEAALKFALRGMGKLLSVGKSFGIFKLGHFPFDIGLPRKERKAGRGHTAFAVDIDPTLSLKEAAFRRDFTVNAIYLDILSGEIVDPLDGVNDLKQATLRHCSNQFAEDPLRVLRAMQFSARLNAMVAPETVAICQKLDPEGLSRERFAGEWEKLLLQGQRPSIGLNFLKESGWLKYFPELAALVGCPQDPRWHPEGDVWTHTLHCMDALPTLRTGVWEDDLTVALAVLCHDFGKPLTTVIGPDGIRSPRHESAGLEPARQFIQRLRISKKIQENALLLVACHMRPATLYRDKSSAAALRRLANDCGRLDLLLRVFRADNAGRPGLADDSADAARWIENAARKLKIEASRPTPILKGRHLLKLGMTPGPAMGELLKAAYEAQLDGLFGDEDAAMEWAHNHIVSHPGSPKDQLPSDT